MGSRNAQRRHAKAVHRKKVLAERPASRRAAKRGPRPRSTPGASGAASLLSGAKQIVRERIRDGHPDPQDRSEHTRCGRLPARRLCASASRMFSSVKPTRRRSKRFSMTRREAAPFEAVDPSYARKLLHEAVAYARSLGLEPHADYAAVEQLFGDIPADAGDVQFEFGRDGKPLYIPGPNELPTEIRRRIDLLSRRLGSDGFEFHEFEDQSDALEERLRRRGRGLRGGRGLRHRGRL